MFVSLGELFAIIDQDNNWREVFLVRGALTDAQYEEAKSQLLRVRNKIAHNMGPSAATT